MNRFSNIGFLWEPHHMTQCARVAVNDQKGTKTNFVVICCSPAYNGIYSYPASNTANYKVWFNNHRPCYEIPMKDLTFVQSLESIECEEIRKQVIKEQQTWYKTYCEKPQEWMLK